MENLINNKTRLTTNTVNQMIINGFYKLESVGCFLDLNVGSVYPIKENGTPDYNCEISLYEDEVSYEWLNSLSKVDYKKIKPFL